MVVNFGKAPKPREDRGARMLPEEQKAKRFFASRGIKPSLAEFREVSVCMRNGSKPFGIH